MRKIIVLSMISLDGVLQAPGGPKEDKSGGFKYGGWTAPYGDEVYSKTVQKELSQPTDFLLGRKTFQIWENYWPKHGDFWPALMKAQNMSYPGPGKSRIGKIPFPQKRGSHQKAQEFKRCRHPGVGK
jgi:dihydrofolate reductase